MVRYENIHKSTLVESEPIVALIFKKQWSKVLQALMSDKSKTHSCDALRCNRCVSSHAPLQFLCCCNPPVAVVRAMIKANPAAVNQVDCMNRLPLHIACGYGASPGVIRLLLESNPSATMRKDKIGRLPLHTLCENYMGWCDPQLSEDEVEERLMTIIMDLIRISPASLHAEDDEEMCPIEYAIEADFDHMVVYKMQKASIELREQKTAQ